MLAPDWAQKLLCIIVRFHFKILSTHKLETLFQKYNLELTTSIHAYINHAFVNNREF